VALAKHLLSVGVPVVVYDPAAMENAQPQLAGKVTFAASAADYARQADALAIATPWAEFRETSPKDFKRHGTVLDCWRLLDQNAVGAVVEYLALGFGARQPSGTTQGYLHTGRVGPCGAGTRVCRAERAPPAHRDALWRTPGRRSVGLRAGSAKIKAEQIDRIEVVSK
jgi:hypothetical protein